MVDLNQVTLIGRLTRDAELKYIPNGTAVYKFSIAVNRRRKNGDQWEDEPNFFDIILWGRQAEILEQYLIKGKQVATAAITITAEGKSKNSEVPKERVRSIQAVRMRMDLRMIFHFKGVV